MTQGVKRSKKFWLKAAVYLFYLLLLIELSLRSAALILRFKVQHQLSKGKEKSALVIHCYGDSNVFGIGASPRWSFPDQIKNLLNRFAGNQKFKVINFGLPGYNSYLTLQKMIKEVEKSPPHLVIVLVGANNQSIFYESNIFKLLPQQKFSPRAAFFLKSILENLKIYKTISYFLASDKDKFLRPKLLNDELLNFFSQPETQKKMMMMDFLKMQELADRYGFKLLFMTYHREEYAPYLMEVLNEGKFPYVDNLSLFKPFLEAGKELVEFYDGHPNAIGYGLIALNLLAYLKHTGMVEVEAEKSPKFLDKYPLSLEVKDLSSILELLFENFQKREFLAEISSPQEKFERIKLEDRENKVALYLKNGELYFIHYPEQMKRFDLSLILKEPSSDFIRLCLGPPHKIVRYEDKKRYPLIDEKWHYKQGLTELELFLNGKVVKYGYLHPYDPPYPETITKIFNHHPTIDEILAVFGNPSFCTEDENSKTLYYTFNARYLTIKIADNRVIHWQVDSDLGKDNLFRLLSGNLGERYKIERVKSMLGEPDFALKPSPHYQIYGWLEEDVIAVESLGVVENLWLFHQLFDPEKLKELILHPDFSKAKGQLQDMEKMVIWQKHPPMRFSRSLMDILLSTLKPGDDAELALNLLPTYAKPFSISSQPSLYGYFFDRICILLADQRILNIIYFEYPLDPMIFESSGETPPLDKLLTFYLNFGEFILWSVDFFDNSLTLVHSLLNHLLHPLDPLDKLFSLYGMEKFHIIPIKGADLTVLWDDRKIALFEGGFLCALFYFLNPIDPNLFSGAKGADFLDLWRKYVKSQPHILIGYEDLDQIYNLLKDEEKASSYAYLMPDRFNRWQLLPKAEFKNLNKNWLLGNFGKPDNEKILSPAGSPYEEITYQFGDKKMKFLFNEEELILTAYFDGNALDVPYFHLDFNFTLSHFVQFFEFKSRAKQFAKDKGSLLYSVGNFVFVFDEHSGRISDLYLR